MNKVVKCIIIISAIACLVGLVLVVVGFFLGGEVVSMGFADGKWISKNLTGDLIDGEELLDEFSELTLESASYKFSMVEGDEYKLEYHVRGDRVPKVEQNGKKLLIKEPFVIGLVFSFDHFDNEVILTVPKDSGCYILNGHSSSGSVSFEGIDLEGQLIVSSGAGRIEGSHSGKDMYTKISSGQLVIEDCEFNELEVKRSSGSAEIRSVKTSKLIHSSSSGSLEMEGVMTEYFKTHQGSGGLRGMDISAENLDIDMSSGNLTMTLIGDPKDYELDISMSSGKAIIDGISYKDGNYNTEGSKEIKVDMSSGRCEIEFEQ